MTLTPETVKRPKILVVDDEVAMVRSLELLLKPLGDIVKAYSVPEAEESLEKEQKFECIVTDVSMPEASGLTLLETVKKKSPETPVVVITAYSSVPQAVEAMHRGAFEYVVKPFQNADLVSSVKKAIAKHGFTAGQTRQIPTGWICNSAAMRNFVEKAERVAQMDSPVLILGQTGVGKRRAARWIHEKSALAKKKFMAIDGRAHEEDSPLLERTVGKDIGTLFVAEVFSLRPRLQDRLADLVREAKIRILASSSSPVALQSGESYREDLRAALSSITLSVPSLKERREDLEALISEKCKELAERLRIPKLEVMQEAVQKISESELAGNIRELELLLERSAIESKGGVISAESIRLREGSESIESLMPFSIPVEDGWSRLTMLVESLEKKLILDALKKYPESSNTEIASMLGTTRRIFELRMKDYGIREEG